MLVRLNGSVQRPAPAACRRREIQILTTRDTDDPDALAVLRHSAAHLLAEAVRRLYPGVKIAIGPPIEHGFYYDFEFPEPIGEDALERSRRRCGASWRKGAAGSARRSRTDGARRFFEEEGEPYKVELVDTDRGRDLPLHARGVHRPLPRAAPAGLGADQGAQAHRPRRRLLARGREEHAADPDLRHRVLLAGRPRRPLAAARGGANARPPPARRAARPLPLRRAVTRLGFLAPQGHGDLERARGPAPARERPPRLQRGEDTAHL